MQDHPHFFGVMPRIGRWPGNFLTLVCRETVDDEVYTHLPTLETMVGRFVFPPRYQDVMAIVRIIAWI